LRRPVASAFEGLGSLFSGNQKTDYQRNMLIFSHFCQMTIASFETDNPNSVRIVDGKKEYLERTLRLFFSHALDNDAIQEFGEIPHLHVE
jgi:hypothetical protein